MTMPKKVSFAIIHDPHGAYEIYGSTYETQDEIVDQLKEQSAYKQDWDELCILTVKLVKLDESELEPEPKKSWWRRLCGL